MHSPSRLEASLKIVKGSHHASAMEQNLCHLLCLVNCMSLPTQLLALVHLLSRCYAPAAYPECRRQNTTAISRAVGAQALAVISGYAVVIQAHPARASKSCTKILLTLRMQPAATALNYSIKNIRNDVQQKIIII